MPEPTDEHPHDGSTTVDGTSVIIRQGVANAQRGNATLLYCQAFAEKLSPFLGQLDRSIAFLSRYVVLDRACVAELDGRIVGVAGFKQDGRGLFEPSFAGFWREYGLSAPLRYIGLALLERTEEPDCLLMDGIAVDASVRGHGIGTRLLQAIETHARSCGCKSIRLDVIDTNPGARRLYERFGFQAGKTTGIGIFRLMFSFRSSTTMIKRIRTQQGN